jgi:hypothetical protein
MICLYIVPCDMRGLNFALDRMAGACKSVRAIAIWPEPRRRFSALAFTADCIGEERET